MENHETNRQKAGRQMTDMREDLKPDFQDRFWPRVCKTDSCWLWNGYCGSKGYPVLLNRGKYIRTHRASWIIHNGPIPTGLLVLHRCDIRHCVRPDHLFLGTANDNSQDMKKKGRSTHGEKNPNARLTEALVRSIRQAHRLGTSINKLARQHGLNVGHASNIVNGKIWKHLA